MAFQIPPQAFISFGRKQVIDTLYRMARQIDESWKNQEERQKAKVAWDSYLEILLTHPSQKVITLAKTLHGQWSNLDEPRELEKAIVTLERESQMNLSDDQFMITTEDTLSPKKEMAKEVHLILDNLRSSFNVGSLIRTSEALGVTKIHLCGYTATPDNSKTAKASLGADHWIKWDYWENTHECIKALQAEGLKIYALETTPKAQDLARLTPQYPCAVLLGNERYGVSEETLSLVDTVVAITLYGRKNSLNVGVCGAMTLNHFIN